MARKRTSAALIKAQTALAGARKRAVSLRKKYNQTPLTKIASIASGGVASAVVDQYSPIASIGGMPMSGFVAFGMVIGGAFVRGPSQQILINVGSGMLACQLQTFTRNQLQDMG